MALRRFGRDAMRDVPAIMNRRTLAGFSINRPSTQIQLPAN